MTRLLSILTIVIAIIAIWYAGAARMNAQWEYDQAERAGKTVSAAKLAVGKDYVARLVGRFGSIGEQDRLLVRRSAARVSIGEETL